MKTCRRDAVISINFITNGMSLTEILPEIRTLSAADKLRFIRLLAEQVDAEGEIKDILMCH